MAPGLSGFHDKKRAGPTERLNALIRIKLRTPSWYENALPRVGS